MITIPPPQHHQPAITIPKSAEASFSNLHCQLTLWSLTVEAHTTVPKPTQSPSRNHAATDHCLTTWKPLKTRRLYLNLTTWPLRCYTGSQQEQLHRASFNHWSSPHNFSTASGATAKHNPRQTSAEPTRVLPPELRPTPSKHHPLQIHL